MAALRTGSPAQSRYAAVIRAAGSKEDRMRSRKLTAAAALAAGSVVALLLATWATGAGQAPARVGSGTASAKKSVCGLGNGKKATGAPIKLGTINMLIPGVDFTTIAKIADAYFK